MYNRQFLVFMCLASFLVVLGCYQTDQKGASTRNRLSRTQITASKRYQFKFPQGKRWGKASKRIYKDGDTIPHGGGHVKIARPYVVNGRTYYPSKRSVRNQVGQASWYGLAFHGRTTANGEIYDRQRLSAAHPTMTLPSYARVTNLGNGRSIVVRVNDRGPFIAGRIIDLSERAAVLLGIKQVGVGKVLVSYLGPASLHGSNQRVLASSFRRRNPRSVRLAYASRSPKREILVPAIRRRNAMKTRFGFGVKLPKQKVLVSSKKWRNSRLPAFVQALPSLPSKRRRLASARELWSRRKDVIGSKNKVGSKAIHRSYLAYKKNIVFILSASSANPRDK